MRTDAGRTKDNRTALARLRRRAIDEERAGASLSGHERNRLFLSRSGEEFLDVSGVTGLDHPGDGRAFAVLDYDRDGWLDIAAVNANAPWFQLFRNEIEGRHRFVALRFVGGNGTSEPSATWSARDGFGASVSVEVDARRILREHRAGEGLAAQNSSTLIVGIGDQERARSVAVRWPSGRHQTIDDVPAGTLLTVYENPAHSPTGNAFVTRPYQRSRTGKETAVPASGGTRRVEHPRGVGEGRSRLRLYTTMATWCAACKVELPQLRRLRSVFSPEELALIGVPIDPAEGRTDIEAWNAANEPVYELRTDWTLGERTRVRELVLDELQFDAVPASIVTDGEGLVLWVQWGPPSISKIRELMSTGSRP